MKLCANNECRNRVGSAPFCHILLINTPIQHNIKQQVMHDLITFMQFMITYSANVP